MTPSWTEVNAAVMAVLGGLGRSNRPTSGASRDHVEVFVERLFSLRHAEALADGSAEIRLASGTVITPLARDFLKRRGVAIRQVSHREADRSMARSRGEWGFAIESRSGQVEAIRRALLGDWLEVAPDSIGAARWVVEEEGRGALVVSDEASVASWGANQSRGIRAATLSEPEAVSRAIRHLGANLIVVEPLGKSIYLLKQIAERFRQGGAPEAPAWIDQLEQPASRARWDR